jgi:GST-like protein
MTLQLYGGRTGNSFRALIGLLEAGIEVEPKTVNLRQGEQLRPDHLALNPDGKVPVLVQRSTTGEPTFVLTQSNAIMFWADAQDPGRLMPAEGDPRRSLVLERYFYFLTDVIGLNFSAFVLRRAGENTSSAILTGHCLRAITAAERFLSDSGYIGGESFSIADIAAWTITKSMFDEVPRNELPALRRWFDSIGARPAVQKGMAAFADD